MPFDFVFLKVQYVMIKSSKNAPAYEKAEDPMYVLENNLVIDSEFYIGLKNTTVSFLVKLIVQYDCKFLSQINSTIRL